MSEVTRPTVPDGMIDLLRGLATNVLRERPENIYIFAAEYFESLLRERDGSLDKGYEKFREYDRRMAEAKHRNDSLNIDDNDKLTKGKSWGKQHVPPNDMGVNGVAMQVNPRESKVKRLPSNRRKHLENSMSDSQDSTDQDQRIATPESNAIMESSVENDMVFSEKNDLENLESIEIVGMPPKRVRKLSSKKPSQNLIVIKEDVPAEEYEGKCNEKSIDKRKLTEDTAAFIIQKAIKNYVTQKKVTNEGETPTNEDNTENASVSEATTIIENAETPTHIGETSSGVVSEHDDGNHSAIVVTEPDENDTSFENFDDTTEQLDIADADEGKMDRLKTPESDSGLSEKSFNLKVQETDHDGSVDFENVVSNQHEGDSDVEQEIVKKKIDEVSGSIENTASAINSMDKENHAESVINAAIKGDAVEAQIDELITRTKRNAEASTDENTGIEERDTVESKDDVNIQFVDDTKPKIAQDKVISEEIKQETAISDSIALVDDIDKLNSNEIESNVNNDRHQADNADDKAFKNNSKNATSDKAIERETVANTVPKEYNGSTQSGNDKLDEQQSTSEAADSVFKSESHIFPDEIKAEANAVNTDLFIEKKMSEVNNSVEKMDVELGDHGDTILGDTESSASTNVTARVEEQIIEVQNSITYEIKSIGHDRSSGSLGDDETASHHIMSSENEAHLSSATENVSNDSVISNSVEKQSDGSEKEFTEIVESHSEQQNDSDIKVGERLLEIENPNENAISGDVVSDVNTEEISSMKHNDSNNEQERKQSNENIKETEIRNQRILNEVDEADIDKKNDEIKLKVDSLTNTKSQEDQQEDEVSAISNDDTIPLTDIDTPTGNELENVKQLADDAIESINNEIINKSSLTSETIEQNVHEVYTDVHASLHDGQSKENEQTTSNNVAKSQIGDETIANSATESELEEVTEVNEPEIIPKKVELLNAPDDEECEPLENTSSKAFNETVHKAMRPSAPSYEEIMHLFSHNHQPESLVSTELKPNMIEEKGDEVNNVNEVVEETLNAVKSEIHKAEDFTRTDKSDKTDKIWNDSNKEVKHEIQEKQVSVEKEAKSEMEPAVNRKDISTKPPSTSSSSLDEKDLDCNIKSNTEVNKDVIEDDQLRNEFEDTQSVIEKNKMQIKDEAKESDLNEAGLIKQEKIIAGKLGKGKDEDEKENKQQKQTSEYAIQNDDAVEAPPEISQKIKVEEGEFKQNEKKHLKIEPKDILPTEQLPEVIESNEPHGVTKDTEVTTSDDEDQLQPDSLDNFARSDDQSMATDSLMDFKSKDDDGDELTDSLVDLKGLESLKMENLDTGKIVGDNSDVKPETTGKTSAGDDLSKEEHHKGSINNLELQKISENPDKNESVDEIVIKSNVKAIQHLPPTSASDLMGDVIEPNIVQTNVQSNTKMKLLTIASPEKDHTIYSIQEVDTPRTPITPRPIYAVASFENIPDQVDEAKEDSNKLIINEEELKLKHDVDLHKDKIGTLPIAASLDQIDTFDNISDNSKDSKHEELRVVGKSDAAAKEEKKSDEKENEEQPKNNVLLQGKSIEESPDISSYKELEMQEENKNGNDAEGVRNVEHQKIAKQEIKDGKTTGSISTDTIDDTLAQNNDNQQDEIIQLVIKTDSKDNGYQTADSKTREHSEEITTTGNQTNVITEDGDPITDSNDKFKADVAEPNASSTDVLSSEISDTETEQPDQKFNESGVDETSRDERDEISEIENFDLSSCGEDSLEAMYYVIRKNEILLDRMHKTEKRDQIEDITQILHENSTGDLNAVVYEDAEHKIIKGQESIDSLSDDVILKNIPYRNSLNTFLEKEWIGEEEERLMNKRSADMGGETSEEEFISPIVASIRKNESLLNDMHAKAYSVNQIDLIGNGEGAEGNEDDTFAELPVDDMKFGNIQRKILASSMSEADSDYSEKADKPSRLVKDDFNISTAFDYLPDSTDSESTIESAATKIQAGARGFLTRKRLRKSTSASAEIHSSIGNAAIDKSLDDLVKQLEQSEKSDEGSGETVDVLGITEIKFEQRYTYVTTDGTTEMAVCEEQYENIIVSRNSEDQQRSDSMDVVMLDEFLLSTQPVEEHGTAQRRMTLQRGDALQRNSTPEEMSSRQNSTKGGSGHDGVHEEPDMESTVIDDVDNEIKKSDSDSSTAAIKAGADTDVHKTSRNSTTIRTLGPRQRSMPVQIEAQFMRVVPKHLRKRVKSASASTKEHKKQFKFTT